MRRQLQGAPLALILIITMSMATAAQAASDEDTAMRTTEVPGSGVGVTLPVEWRIWSWTDERLGESINASDVQGKRTCTFRLRTDVSSAEAMADETIDAVSRHKTEVQQTTHDVPAGMAVRVSYRYLSLPDVPQAWQHEYYLEVPSGVVSVSCWGDPPATDRWLSIVEAIVPIPADGAAVMPVVVGESYRTEATYLDLPAGRVARIDSFDGEPHWSAYILPRDKTIHMLVCEGPERPGQDWDSIARSIELLSAEA
jgi:hypothetical protein